MRSRCRCTCRRDPRIDVAEALTTILPGTLDALEAGDISYRHAMVITELCGSLDAEVAARIEAAVLGRAADQTPSQFRQAVRRSRLKHAPELAAREVATAVRGRDVVMYPGENAMGTVSAHLPAADAAIVYQAIDTLAHLARDRARDAEQPGDPIDDRGIAAWRADVLTAWARAVLADPNLPKRHGRPVPSTWSSTCPPRSAWQSTRPSWSATARSPPRWPENCSPTTRPGAKSSPTPTTDTCSRSGNATTGPGNARKTTSSRATAPADSPGAPEPPNTATSTTPNPTNTAVTRRWPTAAASADATTSSKPSAAGHSNHFPTAPAPGPPRAAGPTTCQPAATSTPGGPAGSAQQYW
jgi:hypothetical protein